MDIRALLVWGEEVELWGVEVEEEDIMEAAADRGKLLVTGTGAAAEAVPVTLTVQQQIHLLKPESIPETAR